MSIKNLQDFTFVSRYAQYLKNENRRETFEEAVTRMKNMHLTRYPQIADEINEAFEFVYTKRVLGSQRAMQFAGPALLAHHGRGYNCTASYCDRLSFFNEAFYLLLCGAGVGFSVQKHHIAKLPKFANKLIRKDRIFTIPDSIEGWADALGVLLSSHFQNPVFPEYGSCDVIFDYSQIRPKGSPLSHGCGKAPGPEPLKVALTKINRLIYRRKLEGDGLRPIDAYDILMHASDAVLSGGVRRSATACLFSPDDEDMINAKTGNWLDTNPQRGRSNNSAVLLRDKTSKEEFLKFFNSTRQFGEPGFAWVDNTESLYNPCVTADTWIMTDIGPKQVSDLIDKPFKAIVNGKAYKTVSNGFFYTGYKPVFELKLRSGHKLKVTDNHEIKVPGGFKALKDLNIGDEVCLSNHQKLRNTAKFISKVKSITSLGFEDVYDCTVDQVHEFCANGIRVHNCFEINLYGYDDQGNSGWQVCNLCEINGGKVKSLEDFAAAAKAAAIIGTVQAGYTDFPYLGSVSENIIRKEALLGVSITGIMENSDVLLNKEYQIHCANIVNQVNKEIASKIGINPAARTTTVKPAGTSSCLLGTSSGIHPHHARRYFRNVQCNNLDPVLTYFKQHNNSAVEPSVWSANNTDSVITFCVEVPEHIKIKNDLSAIDMLEAVKTTYNNWVTTGKNIEHCAQPWLCHNVSNTINVKDSEWDAVADYIYENKNVLAGISLLPISGDKDYPQAPFCTVYTPMEIAKRYGDGSLMASGLIVDGLRAFNNDLWEACKIAFDKPTATTEVFIKKKLVKLTADQLDWVRRAIQFANRYFNGDLRKTTYCLKDVHNWKRWCDLNREYADVDYTKMVEEENVIKFAESSACAGGVCEIL